MIAAALISAALVTAGLPDTSPPTAADRVAYEAARATAARDPDAHVKLALWCEGCGDGRRTNQAPGDRPAG